MKKRSISPDQEQFPFALPILHVIEAVRTENWHEVHEAKDIVQQPEWALYCCLYAHARGSLTIADDLLGSGEIEISLPKLEVELCMCKSSLRRSMKRLSEVKWIKFKSGKGRGNRTKCLVYNLVAITQIVKDSGCTHYCMQGGKRALYRDTASSHIDGAAQG
jgi:hypothetical protein